MASPAFGVVAFMVLLSQMFVVHILCDLWPSSIHVADPNLSEGTQYVFESIASAVLFAIWLLDPALGSQIIKYFATGTALFLAPAWVPPCLDRLHAVISGARLPPIYVEANAFWNGLFKRVSKQIAPRAAQAWFLLDLQPTSPIVPLAEAVVLPALASLAAEASMSYMFRLFCLSVRGLRTGSKSRAFRWIEDVLFSVVDVVFWRIPCVVHSLFHQLLSRIRPLGSALQTQLRCILGKATSWTSQQLSQAKRRLLQALCSPFFAVGTLARDLARNVHEPGSVYIDPRLEAICFYTAFFFTCFLFSGYVHVVHLGYPLYASIPLSAGWAGVLLLYSAVAEYFAPPPNLESGPFVDVSEIEIPPHPANAAPVQPCEATATPLDFSAILVSELDIPPRPANPAPRSPPRVFRQPSLHRLPSEEESTTDWTFVSRRSQTDVPLDLHRALSPIIEVSSVASNSSVAASSPSSSATPSPSPSPKHTAAIKTPLATPQLPSSLLSTSPIRPNPIPVPDVQRVCKARAERDMAEFRSFSLALENRAVVRPRPGGNGDLQSNGAVGNDVHANTNLMAKTGAEMREERGGGGALSRAIGWRSQAGAKLPCHPKCDAFYCVEENGASLI
ncbi:hypothetical protein MSAN_00198800 [Mycena sanguinolenta]|uniref:Uncharacterized protein n=1 Tax=Mycena sanguinolenta TaxID=230812 RepID=A0A8H7DMG2_9AGAR|nr:hypothetical protein MSAN_00198800 [Mycena sanguinolenta]